MLRQSRTKLNRILLNKYKYPAPIVNLHTTRVTLTSASKDAEILPFSKLAQGLNDLRSTVLQATPFKNVAKPASIPFTGKAESWDQALSEAQSLVEKAEEEKEDERIIDPAKLVGDNLKEIKENITKLLGSTHPHLNKVARHYFSGEGKHVRPLLILLIAQATSVTDKRRPTAPANFTTIDTPISTGLKNIVTNETFNHKMHYTPHVTDQGCTILPTQRRLAEITEMIHTASLLHDDVIDASMTRRSLPSVNASFGNKMAILGGDFLLARASLALARLRNAECTELMTTCVANLVEGEFMQLKNVKKGTAGRSEKSNTFEHYLEKSYMKTGSLIAQSCKSSAVLGGCTKEVASIAFDFGRNLGLAFQLIDDMLDFTITAAELGKPAAADLKLGLATAPVLFAWEEYPELEPMMKRKFSNKGDVEKARDLVYQSDGLKKTLELATHYCNLAKEALYKLPPSDARSALVQITNKLLTRRS
ncbi:solanesyl pyrophosphate synthase [Mycotypha africana]|uniref:solanesyl pyrophosphate synthase n=1 Tax=Mycotypha africana TaxID=64632 RepID=UPI0023018F5C|nr:solanesyl pyrophosphate synthase [Mycotypha africana]KAI8987261.1 solanesyl pyrophosphate synthase [Mycotypha africana]